MTSEARVRDQLRLYFRDAIKARFGSDRYRNEAEGHLYAAKMEAEKGGHSFDELYKAEAQNHISDVSNYLASI